MPISRWWPRARGSCSQRWMNAGAAIGEQLYDARRGAADHSARTNWTSANPRGSLGLAFDELRQPGQATRTSRDLLVSKAMTNFVPFRAASLLYWACVASLVTL